MVRFEGDTLAAALRAERDGDELLAAVYARPVERVPRVVMTMRDIVIRYKAAPDGLLRLRESTRRAWVRWLDDITDEFGDLPAAALKAKGVRSEFIAWRDKRAAHPRNADYGMQVLKRLLSFAVEHELADANPTAGIKGIYSNDRSDQIVEPAELQAILDLASPSARLAFRLAAVTGMRRGDLIDLKWSEVSDLSIERAAGKSNTGRRIMVPLTLDARAVLRELRAVQTAAKVKSFYVLTSRSGAWTGSGLTSTWVKIAKLAGVKKHLHDLRGTAITGFCLAGLTDEEIADMVGWEPTRVRAIRKRYVDRDSIARGIIARLERHSENG